MLNDVLRPLWDGLTWKLKLQTQLSDSFSLDTPYLRLFRRGRRNIQDGMKWRTDLKFAVIDAKRRVTTTLGWSNMETKASNPVIRLILIRHIILAFVS